jgi:hypothetical protein
MWKDKNKTAPIAVSIPAVVLYNFAREKAGFDKIGE